MKAWVYRPDRHDGSGIFVFLEETPLPRVGAGDLLLRVKKTSVCGTDEMLFAGKLRRASSGVIPGHELCGEILELGRDTAGFQPGQIVAVESHYQVPGGLEEGVIGLWPPKTSEGRKLAPYNGGYAQFVRIPAACAHVLPAELIDQPFWPSLFEPAGNDFLLARWLTHQVNPSRVGVFGCGPHGLYTQIFLSHLGVRQVVAFEPNPHRRAFAQQLGCASEVLQPDDPNLARRVGELTRGELFDACVDMVGQSGDAFARCRQLTREGGTVVLFGLFYKDFSIAGRNANDLIFRRQRLSGRYDGKQLSVVGITGRDGIWGDLIGTVAANRELQRQLMKPVTVVGPLDRLGENARNRRPDLLKAAFEPFE
ncbi:MAG: zinc-binding dehydrogenase [Acidobacteriota bacterium]